MSSAEPQAGRMPSQPRRVSSWWWRLNIAAVVAMLVVSLATYELIHLVLPYAVVGTFRGEHELRYRGVTPASLGLRADAF